MKSIAILITFLLTASIGAEISSFTNVIQHFEKDVENPVLYDRGEDGKWWYLLIFEIILFLLVAPTYVVVFVNWRKNKKKLKERLVETDEEV